MDQYITPTFAKIMGKTMTPEPSSVPALAQTRDDAPIDPSVPDKIQFELPETSWYLLQMGAYADPEEAHAQALLIQSMGAGGYIYEDEQGFNRVFAAAYEDQESLLQVQQQVRSSGYENTAYSIHPDGVKVTLTGQVADAKKNEISYADRSKHPGILNGFCLKI